MKSICKVMATSVALILAIALPARATSISIDNASFEDPATASAVYGTVTDWTLTGTGNGGVWNISNNLGGCPGDCWTPLTAPDGANIGWLSVGPSPGSSASLSQTLSDSLLPNRIYTLTGVYGHPRNFAAGTIFTAELFAGATSLGTFSGTGPEANFATFSISYASGISPPSGNLQIVLSSNQAQTGFDDIALTAVPDGGLTAVLLGLAMTGLGLFRRALK